jgi:hypothetical protein
MGGACSADWEEKGVYRVLVGKPERKGQLGRPRLRWEDNISLDLQEVGCGLWTGLGWLRIEIVEDHCVCGNRPSGFINS